MKIFVFLKIFNSELFAEFHILNLTFLFVLHGFYHVCYFFYFSFRKICRARNTHHPFINFLRNMALIGLKLIEHRQQIH